MDLPLSTLPTDEQRTELLALHEEWSLSRLIRLPPSSTVVLAGAYKGKLMQWFLERDPTTEVHGYEPQEWARQEATSRLRAYPNWYLSHRALGTKDAYNVPMGEWGTDGCSFLTTEREQGVAEIMVDAAIELPAAYTAIDLLVLNMEGYEFELLPYLLKSGVISSIWSLAVQFHTKYTTPSQYHELLYLLDRVYPNRFNYNLPAWGYWWRG